MASAPANRTISELVTKLKSARKDSWQYLEVKQMGEILARHREKARLASDLESIEGLGPARRRALLKAFGGVAQLRRASLDEIARVEGVNATLAARIHAHFR